MLLAFRQKVQPLFKRNVFKYPTGVARGILGSSERKRKKAIKLPFITNCIVLLWPSQRKSRLRAIPVLFLLAAEQIGACARRYLNIYVLLVCKSLLENTPSTSILQCYLHAFVYFFKLTSYDSSVLLPAMCAFFVISLLLLLLSFHLII